MKASVFLTKINNSITAISTEKTAYKALDASRPRWNDCYLKDDGTVFVAVDSLPIADVQGLIDWLKTLLV